MVSTRPLRRLPRGTRTLLATPSGVVTTAVTSSPTSERAVFTDDSSFASRRVPAGTVGPVCGSKAASNKKNEMTTIALAIILHSPLGLLTELIPLLTRRGITPALVSAPEFSAVADGHRS